MNALAVFVGFSIGWMLAPATSTAQPRGTASKPYQRLFGPNHKAATDRALASAQREGEVNAPKCTMRIIPADPSIDPKMRLEPKKDDTRHTMRLIPPPCHP